MFQNLDFQKEVENIIEENCFKKLEDLFLKRLNFGTAGIRGRIGCGYSQMNDLVIIQTSQGLLEWIKTVTPHKPKVIIGYDGRHHSRRYHFIFNILLSKLKKIILTTFTYINLFYYFLL